MLIAFEDACAFLRGYRSLLSRQWGTEPGSIEQWVEARTALFENEGRWHELAESPEEKEVAQALDQRLCGRFIYHKTYKDHSALFHAETNRFYAVLCLTTDFPELLGEYTLIETCIVPFRGNIACDGLLVGGRIYFGSNMTRNFRDEYWQARRSGQLVWMLGKEEAVPAMKLIPVNPPQTQTNIMPEKPMKKPTQKQREYLAFIHSYTNRHGYPPSQPDMVEHFRVSGPSVHQMIVRLEENGFLTKQPGVARSIKLLYDFEGEEDSSPSAGKRGGKTAKTAKSKTKGSLTAWNFRVEVENYVGEVIMTGDWSLYDLADTIIQCVRFDLDHPFEFVDNIEDPYNSKKCYSLFADMGMPMDDNIPDPGVKNTMISQVFKKGTRMLFHFDYGDDWFMRITCTRVWQERISKRRARHMRDVAGVPPAQYPEME